MKARGPRLLCGNSRKVLLTTFDSVVSRRGALFWFRHTRVVKNFRPTVHECFERLPIPYKIVCQRPFKLVRVSCSVAPLCPYPRSWLSARTSPETCDQTNFRTLSFQASYMHTMSALVQSGQWGRARSLLEVMRADGIPPSVRCHSHLLKLLHTRWPSIFNRIFTRKQSPGGLHPPRADIRHCSVAVGFTLFSACSPRSMQSYQSKNERDTRNTHHRRAQQPAHAGWLRGCRTPARITKRRTQPCLPCRPSLPWRRTSFGQSPPTSGTRWSLSSGTPGQRRRGWRRVAAATAPVEVAAAAAAASTRWSRTICTTPRSKCSRS